MERNKMVICPNCGSVNVVDLDNSYKCCDCNFVWRDV